MYGERIKMLRKKHRMTMDVLAEKIEVAKSSIAGYESEYRQPPLEKLQKLAEVFNTSTDYIIGLTDDPDSKKEYRNVKEFLDKDTLHWDGKPLKDEELKPIREMLEIIVRDRLPKRISDKQNGDCIS